jgi:hypothetical protein
MYRPNFCSQCGCKIVRLHWHLWTSRHFCDACARSLRGERVRRRLLSAVLLLGVGVMSGRALRPTPPPLTIQRRADSPLLNNRTGEARTTATSASSAAEVIEEAVYICGARTKKGTPCSRRVHQPERCWQHRGMPAMLPNEKLRVK